jgi:hypothetical protein
MQCLSIEMMNSKRLYSINSQSHLLVLKRPKPYRFAGVRRRIYHKEAEVIAFSNGDALFESWPTAYRQILSGNTNITTEEPGWRLCVSQTIPGYLGMEPDG